MVNEDLPPSAENKRMIVAGGTLGVAAVGFVTTLPLSTFGLVAAAVAVGVQAGGIGALLGLGSAKLTNWMRRKPVRKQEEGFAEKTKNWSIERKQLFQRMLELERKADELPESVLGSARTINYYAEKALTVVEKEKYRPSDVPETEKYRIAKEILEKAQKKHVEIQKFLSEEEERKEQGKQRAVWEKINNRHENEIAPEILEEVKQEEEISSFTLNLLNK